MKQAILTKFPWPWLPTLALVIFFLFFVGLMVLISRKSARPLHMAAANLPLEEGDSNE